METTTAPEVQIEDMKEKSVVGIRFQTAGAELPTKLKDIFGRVFTHLNTHFVKADSAYCLYHDMSAETWDVEAGFIVHQIVASHDNIQFGTLPNGKAATLWHFGPFHTLNESWMALAAGAKENHLQLGKIMWEVYTTSSQTEPDPAKQCTLLVWPVK